MRTTEKNLYIRLEILRGISAILVLVDHTYTAYLERFFGVQHTLSLAMAFIGMHAVIIFFLLSGYLISLSCKNNVRKNSIFDVRKYLKSRILRIYPPLILSIFIIILIYIVINYFSLPGSAGFPYGVPGDLFVIREYFKISLFDISHSLVMNGGLLNANGPLWSLYIEARMYVLALFLYLGLFSMSRWVKASCFLALVFSIYIFDFINKENFKFVYAVIWCIGAFVFFLRDREYLFSKNIMKILAVILFIYLIFLAINVPRFLDVGNPNNLIREGGKILFGLFYAAIIFFIGLKNNNWPFREYFSKSSKFSYSLYVLHYPILLFGLSIFQGWMGESLLISFLVSFIMIIFIIFAAYISSIFTEKKYFYTNA